jgi:hypothetical protein
MDILNAKRVVKPLALLAFDPNLTIDDLQSHLDEPGTYAHRALFISTIFL